MKTTTYAFSATSVLLISIIATSVFKIGLAAALTDATSTITGTTTASALPSVESTSTTPVVATGTTTTATSSAAAAAPFTDNATSTAASFTSQGQGQNKPPKAKPALKLVHIVGSKYIDYFTDGTTTYSFPGDSAIDANLNKPNASIPFHNGLTWVSTKGMEAYDTASGDLEPGTYAQEADGSFIVNAPDASLSDASISTNAHLSFSKLNPTLDVSVPAPAAASTSSSALTAAADTSDASTSTSASTTPIATAASTTPSIPSPTTTLTTTAIESSAASTTTSSTTASTANDNTASTTTATSTAQ